ncbi:MAG: DUF975 family protein [Lachnospiraceae bacterium]|nr:DUF975 family protein [Lachnospiraceae bacterium]
MMYAYDFRKIARDALRGRWGLAVITGVIATLLGGAASIGPELELKISDSGRNIGVAVGGQQIFTTAETAHFTYFPVLSGVLIGVVSLIVVIGLIVGALYFILGSVIEVGYSRFNLELVDPVDQQKNPDMGVVFGYFSRWKTTAVAKLLQSVYIFLWSLLLIIPGIVASYSYAMTKYILAERPELTASEAIQLSKEMMYGNRWRLFCLQFSFIGWAILSALTLGIGNLWLNPYTEAATAAFYREISGTWYVGKTEEAGFAAGFSETV